MAVTVWEHQIFETAILFWQRVHLRESKVLCLVFLLSSLGSPDCPKFEKRRLVCSLVREFASMDVVPTRGKKSRYGSNLNAQLKSSAPPTARPMARSGGSKLEVLEVRPRLSKLKKSKSKKSAGIAIPKPLNTPSQALEHNGQDPTINIIAAAGGTGWGAEVEAAQAAAAAAAEQKNKQEAEKNAREGKTAGGTVWGATTSSPAQPDPEPRRGRGLADYNPFERRPVRNPAVVVSWALLLCC